MRLPGTGWNAQFHISDERHAPPLRDLGAAALKIVIGYRLVPMPAGAMPNTASRTSVPVMDFPSGVFERFEREFATTVENSWNRRLQLRARIGGLGRVQGLWSIPIKCKIELRHSRAPQLLVHVYHTHSAADWIGNCLHGGAPRARDPDMHISSWDLRTRHARTGGPGQVVAAHELGHYFGLQHPICNTDNPRCYGAPGSAEDRSIMGTGMEVTAAHAKPWRDTMKEIEQRLRYERRLDQPPREVTWEAEALPPSPPYF